MIAEDALANTKSILVVEDDKNILFAVSTLLEGEGYRVFGAENGFAALESIEKNGLPNLILLDMIMPGMDGWRFASEFMAKYDHKTPIIVMTAAADAKQRAKNIGANGWIGKPFVLDELLGLIKKHART
jgi:CheY-like chemotaxis protein